MAYTGHPYEWNRDSSQRMATASLQERNAMSSRGGATTDIAITFDRSMDAAATSGQALSQWTATNETVKAKLEEENAAVAAEIVSLQDERARTHACSEQLKPAFGACQQSNALRAGRPARELILDDSSIAIRDQEADYIQSFTLLDQVLTACDTELSRLGDSAMQLGKHVGLKSAHLELGGSAAIPMENPYCSCKLTRVRSHCRQQLRAGHRQRAAGRGAGRPLVHPAVPVRTGGVKEMDQPCPLHLHVISAMPLCLCRSLLGGTRGEQSDAVHLRRSFLKEITLKMRPANQRDGSNLSPAATCHLFLHAISLMPQQ